MYLQCLCVGVNGLPGLGSCLCPVGHVGPEPSQRGCQTNDAVLELLPLSLVGSCSRMGRLEGLLELTTLTLERRQLSLVALGMERERERERERECAGTCVSGMQVCMYTGVMIFKIKLMHLHTSVAI